MLELRALNESDIPLIEVWLNKPHIKKWYEIPAMGVTIDDWMAEIREFRGEYSWITYLIALWDGQPIGLCLYYKCEDSKGEDFGALRLTGSYGIDYLIGEEAQLGKGRGKSMVALLTERIFSLPDAQRVTADVDKSNAASKNVLLACGFETVGADSGRFVRTKPNNVLF